MSMFLFKITGVVHFRACSVNTNSVHKTCSLFADFERLNENLPCFLGNVGSLLYISLYSEILDSSGTLIS